MSHIFCPKKFIKTYKLLLFVFSISSLFAQNKKAEFDLTEFNNSIHNKIYKIEIADFQVIELIELKNGEYLGSLTNSIWKINQEEGQKKQITQLIKFPNNIAKSILNQCKNENIETLPSCEQVIGYIVGLGGTTVSVSIKTNTVSRTYSYWEPENDSYQNSEIVEVKKMRNILNAINVEFNLTKTFDKFIDGLSTGNYVYGMMIMEKKQKPM